MKYILTFFAIALIGVGCIGAFNKSNTVQEGDWTLAFDLPEGWHMLRSYAETGNPADATLDIDKTDTEVFIQSSPNHIFTVEDERLPDDLEPYGDYVTENYTKISVLRLDQRRVIATDELEDLGDGFYKENEEVYYLDLGEEKYKFIIWLEGDGLETALETIMSAKRVSEE